MRHDNLSFLLINKNKILFVYSYKRKVLRSLKYKQKIPENLIKNIQASDKIYVNAWYELMPTDNDHKPIV